MFSSCGRLVQCGSQFTSAACHDDALAELLFTFTHALLVPELRVGEYDGLRRPGKSELSCIFDVKRLFVGEEVLDSPVVWVHFRC